MSGFFITNKLCSADTIDHANYFSKFRGRDDTRKIQVKDTTFVHNNLVTVSTNPIQPYRDDNIVCVYDGTIYNYSLREVIKLYRELGSAFVRKLDGEFSIALADLNKNRIIVSTDTFRCKPIFVSIENGYLGVSSLMSCLTRLGFSNLQYIKPNTTHEFCLLTGKLINNTTVTDFNVTNEYKTDYKDWVSAFERAVLKRVDTIDTDYGVVADMSEGYDTGAIIACLRKYNRLHRVIVRSVQTQRIPSNILLWRFGVNNETLPHKNNGDAFLPVDIPNKVLVKFNPAESILSERLFNSRVEDFNYTTYESCNQTILHNVRNQASRYCYLQDKKYIIKHNIRVCITGLGGGAVSMLDVNRLYSKTIVPESYDETVYVNEMTNMDISEVTGGSLGVELRSPFYDRDLWQETFFLNKKIYGNENNGYKSPIHHYLESEGFPFYERDNIGKIIFSKIGFNNPNVQ